MKSEEVDAVVIGSGFGGSLAAYRLASSGLRTLLLERGDRVLRDDLDWSPREILVHGRYRSESPLRVRQSGKSQYESMDQKEALGGMSVFYGGASLRLRPTDLTSWPITYEELEPYYSQAEWLLEVHGWAGRDPFEPPRSRDYPFRGIPLTAPARRISDAARRLGYRPFEIPLAINFHNPGRSVCVRCITCDAFPCKMRAKNDLCTTVLAKAQAFGLEVRVGAIVRRLVHEQGRVTAVESVNRWTGEPFSIRARTVVLAAGAIQSPAVLFRSDLGAAGGVELVGRFLMRHCNSVVSGLFPFRTNPEGVFHKQICLTDFYEDFRGRLSTATGVIQDTHTPAPEVLHHFAPLGLKSLAFLAQPFLQHLLCIAEDAPQYENRVCLEKDRDPYGMETIQVDHTYGPEDCERRDYLVEKSEGVMREAGGTTARVTDVETFSHALGTLRFGDHPRESVLDPDCRYRGLDNLFVTDGSFTPTSGGVNPSLTIAANALRVGDAILGHLG